VFVRQFVSFKLDDRQHRYLAPFIVLSTASHAGAFHHDASTKPVRYIGRPQSIGVKAPLHKT